VFTHLFLIFIKIGIAFYFMARRYPNIRGAPMISTADILHEFPACNVLEVQRAFTDIACTLFRYSSIFGSPGYFHEPAISSACAPSPPTPKRPRSPNRPYPCCHSAKPDDSYDACYCGWAMVICYRCGNTHTSHRDVYYCNQRRGTGSSYDRPYSAFGFGYAPPRGGGFGFN
jgi:hypothetical protein